jgi:hypothetical protein
MYGCFFLAHTTYYVPSLLDYVIFDLYACPYHVIYIYFYLRLHRHLIPAHYLSNVVCANGYMDPFNLAHATEVYLPLLLDVVDACIGAHVTTWQRLWSISAPGCIRIQLSATIIPAIDAAVSMLVSLVT